MNIIKELLYNIHIVKTHLVARVQVLSLEVHFELMVTTLPNRCRNT